MRYFKYNPILSIVNHYLIDGSEPININYFYNFGSILGILIIFQIITGLALAFHFIPHSSMAFDSVEYIMRYINYGWLIRYFHSNGASFYFLFLFAHIFRGIYYQSYVNIYSNIWNIGVIIFVLSMATAFMGYSIVYGQMSYWASTVIINLLSVIPYFNMNIVYYIWGGFSVESPTINRFFIIHFILPFIILVFAIIHIIFIHFNGSSNPIGISSTSNKLTFSPYFVFKDIVTIYIILIIFGIFVFYYSNSLNHPDNFIPANPMATPASIVPEWYLLPFYAILRSIESKSFGVIAMFSSIFVLAILPYTNFRYITNVNHIFKILFWIFIFNFIILMFIGNVHPEYPYIFIGKVSTFVYFAYFIIIIPIVSIIENTIYSIYY